MKLDKNICVVPYCEENQLLVEGGCPFCLEHSKKYGEFKEKYEISSETVEIMR